MRFLFVHGWGFDRGVWRGLAPLLPAHAVAHVDLGFLQGGTDDAASADAATVAIGHSLGVMWLLKNMPASPRALVSINGFPRFSPPVPRESVAQMQNGLDRKPLAQMKQFWRSCGVAPYAGENKLDVARLRAGLDWLRDWDATPQLAQLSCPRLVLAANDDAVVSKAMSRAQWDEDEVVWSPAGGHVLPLTRPEWCAQKIGEFVERL